MQWFYELINTNHIVSLISNFKSRDLSSKVISYEINVECKIRRKYKLTNIKIYDFTKQGSQEGRNYKENISSDQLFINNILITKFNPFDLIRQTFGGNNDL